MKLKIIHTNDLHSHFDEFSRAASLIRQHKDESTVLLDGGDFADFRSIELQGTKGMAAIELIESLGYDALTVGNNEMFNGVETLEYMASNSSVPFISNNLYKKDKTRITGIVSSTLIEKKGLRILITGSSPDLDVFNDGLGVHMSDYKTALKGEIDRYYGEYDVCIVMNHIGTAADDQLAAELADIDVILSAHDHQLYPEPKFINGTLRNSAGNYGAHIGILELEVTGDHVKLLDSAMLSTSEAAIDEQATAILRTNKDKAVANLSRPLYHLDQPLWHDVIEENPMANLIADGLQNMLKGDIGLINSGIVNAGLFDWVSDKKLIEICPSPLNPTIFEVKGKDILAAIEQSLDVQACLADGSGPGFRGKFAGRLHVSGAEIVHDGQRVIDMRIGDEPLQEEKWYKVASSDYLQRGSGYPSLAQNQHTSYRPEDIRDVIRMYASQPSFIEGAMVKRWTIDSKVTV
ncbi:bifunctional metallophosphatase/5'-nucleotidase [Sediminibacillus albus]|uniref:2',3'-cyclic-nucleotide 2'-phosphodiesterase/5'-or 3'-nucleotidase, 5'-nucleotidase family n=1 Tax=Sediminibacillus albus TaxID=407036 RepID=A0A1G8WZ14_9BACI|nr:5'-nucleotidase C-terminal domain-containing protein [Sediminibacillus albus]SDJ83316.1 2',3'-cyclic-nucleotide 2'-phosphodiesterase/5'-or 3'-nucleotidase, 5'-nucleotidase family [Sediminibacillus albus]